MRYCWLDIETTGLNPKEHAILEVAAIITDGLFTPIAEFSLVAAATDELVWEPIVIDMHQKSGLLTEAKASSVSSQDLITQFKHFLLKHKIPDKVFTVAGNSVHFDTHFLKAYDADFAKLFAHRHLDVSSIRVVVAELFGSAAKANNLNSNHRALLDIRDSQKELQTYIQHYFKSVPTLK